MTVKHIVLTALAVGLLACVGLANPARAQTIRSVAFFPPVKTWDTTDHVDVQVKKSVQVYATGLDSTGHAIHNIPIRYFSIDTTIAKVSATGLVTGVHRGQIQIGAEVGTPGHGSMHGLFLVCVNDVALTRLQYAQVADTTFLIAMPAKPDTAQLRAISPFTTVQLAAADLRTPAIAWDAPCVHWRSITPSIAKVSRRGLVTAKGKGTVGIVVGVGPARP